MALPSEVGDFRCPTCTKEAVPGGTLYTQTFTSGGPDEWWFGSYFVRDDGFGVNAFESLTAAGEQAAAAQRVLSDSALAALVQDPRLTFG